MSRATLGYVNARVTLQSETTILFDFNVNQDVFEGIGFTYSGDLNAGGRVTGGIFTDFRSVGPNAARYIVRFTASTRADIAYNFILQDNAQGFFAYVYRGRDTIIGSFGNDTLLGYAGDDTIQGKRGANRLVGAAGNDRLFGGGENDTLNGGADDDRLFGRSGNDRLNGQAGDDILRGGAGRDVMIGGVGDDRLLGGVGNDLIITGGGSDRIVIREGQGLDRVRDFTDGLDRIVLGDIRFGQLSIQQSGGGVLISKGSEPLLRLQNTTVGQINAADFA
ncbi:MAG: calcium-binding protein [Cyanobacteria bacterium J06638_22]